MQPRPPGVSDGIHRYVRAVWPHRANVRHVAVVGAAVFTAVFAAGAASPAVERTAELTVAYSDPAWSPRGNRLAVVVRTTVSDGSGSLTSASLAIMSTGGQIVRPVATVEPHRVAWPTWSPDGRRLAFGYDHLYVVNADGSGLRDIGAGCCVAWGPGGRKIAFSSSPETQSEIYVMRPDGSNREIVATPSQGHSYWGPAWSPNGKKLAFFSDEAPDMPSHVKTSLAVIERYREK